MASVVSIPKAALLDSLYHVRIDSVGYNAVTGGKGVEGVPLVQGRPAGDPLQKEGHEDESVFPGHGRVNGVELPDEFRLKAADHSHPGQDYGYLLFLQGPHDLFDVFLRHLRLDPPKAV